MTRGADNPGLIAEDFMKPLGMSANALARALHVPAARINEIARERRGVTPDTALRLARYFGGDAKSWLNLQAECDLKVAARRSGKAIEREIDPRAAGHELVLFDVNRHAEVEALGRAMKRR